MPLGTNWFGTVNRTGDLDSDPSSSSLTPVPDWKAIGEVCWKWSWRRVSIRRSVVRYLREATTHFELTSKTLRSASNRLSTKRLTFVIAFCKSILDKRLVELAAQLTCGKKITEMSMTLFVSIRDWNLSFISPMVATDHMTCTRMDLWSNPAWGHQASPMHLCDHASAAASAMTAEASKVAAVG